jgi:nucleotide-binding universal stress UspA family protein
MTQPLKRIFAPTDYSDQSRRAFAMAVDLAKQFGASIELLHVWPAPYFGRGYGYDSTLALDPVEHKSMFDLIRSNAVKEMQTFVASVEVPPGTTISTHIASGDAPHEILEFIEQHKPDLVVVGTHGRTGPRRWLLGSVAERIVQHSACPVLTVP